MLLTILDNICYCVPSLEQLVIYKKEKRSVEIS